ncbi:hypothetical protein BH11BAC2_BH11BAC2_13190 [soil metagenome]
MKKYILFFLLIFAQNVQAQIDTLYCTSYAKLVTGRLYLSQKYSRLNIRNSKENYNLAYLPNTNLNFGIGATYKWATLNLAYGFPFINPDREKGKTNYLDLQAHFYGSKVTVDFFGQFYRGYYLNPKGTFADKDLYYIRPDIKINTIGTSVQYVFNNKRFSYRAAFLQNEWQRKSCGSVIAGGEIHFGSIQADSSIVPAQANPTGTIKRMTRFNYFEIGPNIGYAYTLVIHKNFFLTGSLALSFDYVTNTALGDDVPVKTNGFSPNTFVRFFAGYNSSLYAFSLSFVNSDVSLSTSSAATSVGISTGNFRMNYVKRFKPGPRSRRLLKHL